MEEFQARGSRRPEVHTFPHSDAQFALEVENAVMQGSVRVPADLEAALSAAYPRVHVTAQFSLARLGGRARWYAYRDGSLTGDQRTITIDRASE